MVFPEDLDGIQEGLRGGEFTVSNLVKYYLSNIESSKSLNAYIEVYADEALEKAALLDARIQSNDPHLGSLFGAVVSIKDLICYRGHSVTAASKILSGFESQLSASAVTAILDADAIIIGRTNCDEFGMGSANKNSYYGAVKNAADPAYIAGGSSGGSAVSVQSKTCLVALGTDTGGSVRQPASLCGLYGFKPSYGMVSRYGLVAYASSFDQLGLIARSAANIDAFMKVISIHDDYDATMLEGDLYPNLSINVQAKSKIAILSPTLENDGLNPAIKSAIMDKVDQWKACGHQVDAVNFDYIDYLVPCYYILTTAEASSNLSRYDGVRYGHRSSAATNLYEMYALSRSEGFGDEVKKRIMLGSFVLSEAYYDAYFTKAQQVRRLIKESIENMLMYYDFIVLPTTSTAAWKHSDTVDPIEMYMSDIYTVLANLVGMPSLSIPLGKTEDGLPFGYQIMAGVKGDKGILKLEIKG